MSKTKTTALVVFLDEDAHNNILGKAIGNYQSIR